MANLTDRQALILEIIKEHIEDSGFPPTRAELAEILGFKSVNAAEDHLRALERKGYIEILPGASRGIRLLEEEGLPVVGRVAAGSPILSEEYVETRYKIDPYLFQPQADYLLQVQGMSMRDAGIYEGDLLAVHKTQRVKNGQVVVARLDGEVTVKRYRKKGKIVELQPENDDFNIIKVTQDNHTDFEIEGLAVGVIRSSAAL
jgi:repressor LexA